MPIKPENRARYPKNWKAIRVEILERAWCQRCHLNYDKHHHALNSAATRRAKSPQAQLELAQ